MIPFAGNPLDRASEKRIDANWIESKRRDPSSLILPMWRLEPFLLGSEKSSAQLELGLLKPGIADSLAGSNAPCIFLGLDGERAVFALDVSDAGDPMNAGPLAGLGHFRDARVAASNVSIKDAAIIGQAKALIDWHQRHGFCPRCGEPTKLMDAGYRRLCGKCNAEHFPRVDPVVIMLATHGEACLVGRGKLFPPEMFSALAGFIEPGETVEEAVRRELMEEASVKVGEVTYYSTQPWPFPSSLMIGCFAKAESRDVKADETELAEVRWIERSVARELVEGKAVDGVRVPPPIAIAYHLIRTWALGEQ
ncbi:MAG: NAD(+) diphosphatase [Candidatus Binatus sp.]|uniref:NAD(+) diphosphatase n=1 Tax=Candidatus Binatus sp. TaxID=2811406 RepID=UPI0027270699|nr:NAD(+) diphosphatase [Candidatus Binatus sp.]MDO8432589.1 NAD(+) diphosphatase [Candidatus Binatus sp.]